MILITTTQKVEIGDNRELIKKLPNNFIDCCITSPPYWRARNYGTPPLIYGGESDCRHIWSEIDVDLHSSGVKKVHGVSTELKCAICTQCNAFRGELGWESSPESYINHLVGIFDLLKPKLKDTGSVWVNLGDKYFDSSCKHDFLKSKSICLIPQRFAWEMIKHGWMCINEVIWFKENHMPEPYKTRLTRAHEQVYHFVKNPDYFYDIDAIREPHQTISSRNTCGIIRKLSSINSYGNTSTFSESSHCEHDYHPLGKNPGTVWSISSEPYKKAHFACFPTELVKRPILATCPKFICKKCGKPRERIMKSETIDRSATNDNGNGAFNNGSFGSSIHHQIGWSDCGCDAEFEPGWVIDPFCGCYDNQTEILTSNGFKPFSYLTTYDKVASLENGCMVFVNPTEIQRFPYNGDMIHIYGKHFDLLITPNHRMYVRKRTNKKNGFVFMKASSVRKQDELKCDCSWKGDDIRFFDLPVIKRLPYKHHQTFHDTEECKINMNDWLEFFGLWIAEGCVPSNGDNVQITQLKNIEQVTTILKKLPFNYTQYGKDFKIYSTRLRNYLFQFEKCKNKFIPVEFKSLDVPYLRSLLHGLIIGDGTIHDNGHLVYYTVSRRLADDVQEILLKLGYTTKIRMRAPRKSMIRGRIINSQNMQYEIYASLKHLTPKINHKDIVADYHGMVYCCTVPSNIILVRRNGRTVWCGNSGSVLEFCRQNGYNAIGFDLNPDYKPLIEERAMLRTSQIKPGIRPFTEA